MDIKTLDPTKHVFVDLLKLLPINDMIAEINNSDIPLAKKILEKTLVAVRETKIQRYKELYYILGVCAAYAAIDGAYNDFMRFIILSVGLESNITPRHFNEWKVNNL